MQDPHDDDDEDQLIPVPTVQELRRAANRPGPMMRFIVVIFGFLFVGMGTALIDAGGAVGWVLGVVTVALGVVVAAIAVGLVEWVIRRRRGRAAA